MSDDRTALPSGWRLRVAGVDKDMYNAKREAPVMETWAYVAGVPSKGHPNVAVNPREAAIEAAWRLEDAYERWPAEKARACAQLRADIEREAELNEEVR